VKLGGLLVKKLLLAGALTLTIAGHAQAADMPLKAPPPRAPVYNWTGWYVGASLGGAWSSNDSMTFSGAGPAAPFFFANNEFPTVLSSSSHGTIGGLQTGYNWQLSSMWLVGVESDIQLSNYAGAAIANPASAALLVPFTTQVTQQSDWFGTLRGRLGILATPNLLVYGTGGFAYGQTTTSFTTLPVGLGLGGFCTAAFSGLTCATGSSSGIGTGWAGGGGLEWMFAPHWTVRAEYLYVDLGSQSATTAPYSPFGHLFVNNFTASSTFHENIARAAVNFGF
jgi:outer membrane immunogenic protein